MCCPTVTANCPVLEEEAHPTSRLDHRALSASSRPGAGRLYHSIMVLDLADEVTAALTRRLARNPEHRNNNGCSLFAIEQSVGG